MASTVAVTANSPLGEVRQRSAFYHAGRRWVFYCDAAVDDVVWKTSLDGLVWGAASNTNVPADVGLMNHGSKFSIFFDGTYVRIAATRHSNGDSLWYRAGTPNADGTITWCAAWVAAVAGVANVYPMYPSICTDSQGYAWITYHRATAGGAIDRPYVTKSGNNDGTWGVTPGGFPWDSGGTSSANWRSVIIPMTGGKVAFFRCLPCQFCVPVMFMQCNIWDGAAWMGMENVSNVQHVSNGGLAMVADGDDLHAMILFNTHTYHSVRSWATGLWSAAQQIIVNHYGDSLAIDPSTHDLYYFYNNVVLVYKEYSAGVWGAEQPFEAEWADTAQAFYSSNHVLGVVWTIGAYTIRYGELEVEFLKPAPGAWEILPLLS